MNRTLCLSVLLFVFQFFVGAGSLFSQDLRATYDANTDTLTIENTNNTGLILLVLRAGAIDPSLNPETQAELMEVKISKEYFENNEGYMLNEGMKIKFKISKSKPINGKKIFYFDHNSCCSQQKSVSVEMIMPKEKVAVQPPVKKESVWWLYVSVGVVLVFLSLFIFYNFFRRKTKVKERSEADPGVLVTPDEDDNEEMAEYIVGLDAVRKDIKNYYTLDARDIYSDTAIHLIYISRLAIKGMNDLFKKFLENPEQTPETGCYIVGRWEFDDPQKTTYNISLEYLVEPGDDVVYGEYALNFGMKIGVILGSTIVNLSEKTKCNYVHTAWMHSHPGLGLFLSSQDLIVQNGLAYSDAKKRMLALVIDTNTPDWQMAIFTPKTNGIMNNKADTDKPPYSLDMLYQWSKKIKEESADTNSLNTENFFELPVKNDAVLSVLFEAKAINDIDDIMYSSNKGLSGFFSGYPQVVDGKIQNILIEECATVHNSQTCGCLIVDSGSAYAEILKKYDGVINKYRFFIISQTDNEFLLSVKNYDGTYPVEEKSLIRFTFDQMKEWTRRRRKIL